MGYKKEHALEHIVKIYYFKRFIIFKTLFSGNSFYGIDWSFLGKFSYYLPHKNLSAFRQIQMRSHKDGLKDKVCQFFLARESSPCPVTQWEWSIQEANKKVVIKGVIVQREPCSFLQEFYCWTPRWCEVYLFDTQSCMSINVHSTLQKQCSNIVFWSLERVDLQLDWKCSLFVSGAPRCLIFKSWTK